MYVQYIMYRPFFVNLNVNESFESFHGCKADLEPLRLDFLSAAVLGFLQSEHQLCQLMQ